MTFDDVAEMQRQLIVAKRKLYTAYVTSDMVKQSIHYPYAQMSQELSNAIGALETATRSLSEIIRLWPVGS